MKPFRIGIIGEFQSGKSLLINCLLQRAVATVGKGVATTHTVVCYRYAEKQDEHFVYCKDNGEVCNEAIKDLQKHDTDTDISVIEVYLNCSLLKDFELIDMPGFGANAADNRAAKKALNTIDFALLVASNEKAMGEDSESFKDLQELQLYNIPYYFILNCINVDRWKCSNSQNVDIAEKDLSLLEFYKPSNYPLEPSGINIVNLMWYWYSICQPKDDLINRDEYVPSFERYHIHIGVREKVGQASNFSLINKLFDMDNRVLLDLKRSFKEEIERVKRELCPIGTIQVFAFNSIPDGWLLCDGSPLQTSEYPDLFHVIGFTFGGDKNRTFKLPDLRGKFVRGWDNSKMIDLNRDFGSPQDDALQEHGHEVNNSKVKISSDGSHAHQTSYSTYKGAGTWGPSYSTYEVRPYNSNSLTDGRGTSYDGNHSHQIEFGKGFVSKAISGDKKTLRVCHETRPKNVALLYCIKYI